MYFISYKNRATFIGRGQEMIRYIFLVALLIAGISTSIPAEKLKVDTEELPPVNMWDAKEEKASEFSVEIVENP